MRAVRRLSLVSLVSSATFALALTLATATTLFGNTAQAAPSGPGCFPELNWTEPFVPAVLDPNNHLFEGEWKVVANGRLHTLEVLEVDAAAGASPIVLCVDLEDLAGNWLSRPHRRSGLTPAEMIAQVAAIHGNVIASAVFGLAPALDVRGTAETRAALAILRAVTDRLGKGAT